MTSHDESKSYGAECAELPEIQASRAYDDKLEKFHDTICQLLGVRTGREAIAMLREITHHYPRAVESAALFCLMRSYQSVERPTATARTMPPGKDEEI
jgi:hypothetical protein